MARTKKHVSEMSKPGKKPPAYALRLPLRMCESADGDILQRVWVFGDGESLREDDPAKHEVSHTYQSPGLYEPSLLLVFAGDKVKRVFLSEILEVS